MIQRAGFPLDDPYVEQCTAARLGTACVLILRRLPALWQLSEPVALDVPDFARSLGLRGGEGGGHSSPVRRRFNRLVQFGHARWTGDNAISVYTEVPPLSSRELRQAPAWTRLAHDRLLDEHVRRLARPDPTATADPVIATLGGIPDPSGPGPTLSR